MANEKYSTEIGYTAKEVESSVGWVQDVKKEKSSEEVLVAVNKTDSIYVDENDNIGFNAKDSDEDSHVINSSNSIASGTQNVIGAKGYYYNYIDFTSKQIYITLEQPSSYKDIGTNPTREGGIDGGLLFDSKIDTSFVAPEYVIGNGISLVNASKYDYKSSSGCTATIKSIDHNCITYEGELGFTEIKDCGGTPGFDDYTLYVPAQPDIGSVTVRQGSQGFGDRVVSTGLYSHAEGRQTKAHGHYSHAEGRNTYANYAAHSEGEATNAYGETSHAEGHYSISEGDSSHAEGYRTHTRGNNSHAEGEYTVTDNAAIGAHVEGYQAYAYKPYSHAEGNKTRAYGYNSHAEGLGTEAHGANSHAEGLGTKAIGNNSHAEGNFTQANEAAHAEGNSTQAVGNNSHAEGNETRAIGNNSHAEGYGTQAIGNNSHAEGIDCIAHAPGSHVEGCRNHVYHEYSHAEGESNEARGYSCHVEGNNNKVLQYGSYAHLEGQNNTLRDGSYTHIEGYNNYADLWHNHIEGHDNNSTHASVHIEGTGNTSTCHGQHIQGQYNSVEDCEDKVHIVGWGSSNTNRKNIHTLDKQGNAWFLGEIYCGEAGAKLATEDYINAKIGDIDSALDELHSYAVALVSGGEA